MICKGGFVRRAVAVCLISGMFASTVLASEVPETVETNEDMVYEDDPWEDIAIFSDYQGEYAITPYIVGIDDAIIAFISGLMASILGSMGVYTYNKTQIKSWAQEFVNEWNEAMSIENIIKMYCAGATGVKFFAKKLVDETGIDLVGKIKSFLRVKVDEDPTTIVSGSYVASKSISELESVLPANCQGLIDYYYSLDSKTQTTINSFLADYNGQYVAYVEGDLLYIYFPTKFSRFFVKSFDANTLTCWLEYIDSTGDTSYCGRLLKLGINIDYCKYQVNNTTPSVYLYFSSTDKVSFLATNVFIPTSLVFDYYNYLESYNIISLAPSLDTSITDPDVVIDSGAGVAVPDLDDVYDVLQKKLVDAGITGMTTADVLALLKSLLSNSTLEIPDVIPVPTPGESESESESSGEGTYPWWPDLSGLLNGITGKLGALDEALKGVQGSVTDIPGNIAGSIASEEISSNAQDYAVSSIISQKFPFCMPFDLISCVTSLQAASIPPRWELPFVIEPLNFKYTIVIDLTTEEWQPIILIIRYFLLLSFVAGLVLLTRNIIKG